MSGDGTTICALCGLVFEPGGSACAKRGCPLAGAGCRSLDCPRCGYAVPDERSSGLARWIRRLFTPAHVSEGAARTLADLRPGEEALLDGIEGDAALAARLTAQGLAPGVAIHLVQRFPSYVVELGCTTLAVERRVARAILIRPVGRSSR